MRSKKCKNCNEPFIPQRPLQYVCTPKCAVEYSRALSDKKERKVRKETILSMKTISSWKKDLEKEVNHIVRIIDEGLPCISCGGYGRPNAGHYHSVGSNDTLRFHLDNIHLQCFQCNHWKSANIIGYNLGLESRYGKDYLDHVRYNLMQVPEIKLSIEEIKDILVRARKVKKELLSVLYSRQEVNNILDIYK
jgi:hypothetical protein